MTSSSYSPRLPRLRATSCSKSAYHPFPSPPIPSRHHPHPIPPQPSLNECSVQVPNTFATALPTCCCFPSSSFHQAPFVKQREMAATGSCWAWVKGSLPSWLGGSKGSSSSSSSNATANDESMAEPLLGQESPQGLSDALDNNNSENPDWLVDPDSTPLSDGPPPPLPSDPSSSSSSNNLSSRISSAFASTKASFLSWRTRGSKNGSSSSSSSALASRKDKSSSTSPSTVLSTSSSRNNSSGPSSSSSSPTSPPPPSSTSFVNDSSSSSPDALPDSIRPFSPKPRGGTTPNVSNRPPLATIQAAAANAPEPPPSSTKPTSKGKTRAAMAAFKSRMGERMTKAVKGAKKAVKGKSKDNSPTNTTSTSGTSSSNSSDNDDKKKKTSNKKKGSKGAKLARKVSFFGKQSSSASAAAAAASSSNPTSSSSASSSKDDSGTPLWSGGKKNHVSKSKTLPRGMSFTAGDTSTRKPHPAKMTRTQSLGGGGSVRGLTLPPLSVGTKVRAIYHFDGQFYDAVIKEVEEEGKLFVVFFPEHDEEQAVGRTGIRRLQHHMSAKDLFAVG